MHRFFFRHCFYEKNVDETADEVVNNTSNSSSNISMQACSLHYKVKKEKKERAKERFLFLKMFFYWIIKTFVWNEKLWISHQKGLPFSLYNMYVQIQTHQRLITKASCFTKLTMMTNSFTVETAVRWRQRRCYCCCWWWWWIYRVV